MDTTIGVVGARDLVDAVAAVCEEQPDVRVHRLDYDHESQVTALVGTHAAGVDAWLFTGVVPYTIALDSLTRPADYVDYSGGTLLRAMIRLLRSGHDVAQLSIDTLETEQVHDTFGEVGVPTDRISTMPYRAGTTTEQFVAFHRRRARRSKDAVAVTCVSSVYDQLAGEMAVFRLEPSAPSVRIALRQLLLRTSSQIREDAQIVIGLVEMSGSVAPSADLVREMGVLAGSISPYSESTSLVATTRGPLSDATLNFTALPMLHRLSQTHDVVQVGFGLGHSGAEAERLARRALSRARSHGPVAAVVSMRNDVDMLLDAATAVASAPSEQSRAVLATRVGLSVQTLDRLRQLIAEAGDGPLTTRDVADGLGVQLRTARRILQRLEMAGLADREGSQGTGASGRPRTLYRVSV